MTSLNFVTGESTSYYTDYPVVNVTLPIPHICPHCNKSYTYKKNLNRHLKYECGKQPSVKCPICSYVTRYKHSLVSHFKKQHEMST